METEIIIDNKIYREKKALI